MLRISVLRTLQINLNTAKRQDLSLRKSFQTSAVRLKDREAQHSTSTQSDSDLSALSSIFSNIAKDHRRRSKAREAQCANPPAPPAADPAALRQQLDELSQQFLVPGLGLDGWYTTPYLDDVRQRLRSLFGRDFLANFNGSIITMLKTAYPRHNWEEWRFSTTPVPAGFWDSLENQRRFFDSVAKAKSFRSLEGFYNVSVKEIDQLGGAGLLASKYNRSLYHALCTVYGDHEWQGWKFAVLPSGYWEEKANRRQFFDFVMKTLNITLTTNMIPQRLTVKEVQRLGGATMLSNFYNNSLPQAIGDLYPAHRWRIRPSKSSSAPDVDSALSSSSLDVFRRILRFFVGADAKGEPIHLDKLYQVSHNDIIAVGGQSILSKFGNSIYLAAKSLYPQHEWHGWKFSRAPMNYWKDAANIRAFFVYLVRQRKRTVEELSEVTVDDLYSITLEDIHREGGASMLQEYFGGKIDRALSEAFPEYNQSLLRWKIQENGFSFHFWSQPTHRVQTEIRSFLEHMAQHPALVIRDPRSWERISLSQLRQANLSNFVRAFGNSLSAPLRIAYPEIQNWSEDFQQNPSKASVQRTLFECVKLLLPSFAVQEAVLLPFGVEVDIFVPKLNLAFEYQGQQHFSDLRHIGESNRSRSIDATKAASLQKHSISLIEVDSIHFDIESVSKAIADARPDIKMATLDQISHSSNTSAPESVKQFLEHASKQLNLNHMEDWYKVSLKDIKQMNGGVRVLRRHGNSLRNMLAAAYPDHKWMEWKFKRVPPGFWSKVENRRAFFEDIVGKQLEQLYSLSSEDVIAAGGGGLLANHYNGSYIRAIQDTFPDKEWLVWRFATVPINFWSDMDNVKQYVEWMRNYLSLRSLDDFYSVSHAQWSALGAESLLKSRTRSEILAQIYPEHEWLPWRFDNVAQSEWKDQGFRRRFLEWCAKQKQVSPSDTLQMSLERLTNDDIINLGGSSLLHDYGGSLKRMLSAVFPELHFSE